VLTVAGADTGGHSLGSPHTPNSGSPRHVRQDTPHRR
jgi:hypothetical protein